MPYKSIRSIHPRPRPLAPRPPSPTPHLPLPNLHPPPTPLSPEPLALPLALPFALPFAFPLAAFWGRVSQIFAIENYEYISKKESLSFHHQEWKGLSEEIRPSLLTEIA